MRFFKSLLFNLIFYVWTILCGIFLWPFIFFPRSFSLKVMKLWSKSVMAAVKWIIGLEYEVRGKDQNLIDQGVILACKHQSTWETVALLCIVEDPAIVLKKSLISIPIFGSFARKLGMIPVARKKGGSSQDLKQMIEKAKEALEARRPLIIFPEGTRTLPGEQKPYHTGIFTLYAQLNVPVIPIALNSGLFWGRRDFIKKPGKISLAFCAPILPGLNRYDFMHRLKQTIESQTAQLIEEASCDQRQTAHR